MQGRTKRQLGTAVATFAAALGIGFVMQYGDAAAGRGGLDMAVTGSDIRLPADPVLIPVAANMVAPPILSAQEIRVQPDQASAGTQVQTLPLDDLGVPALVVPVAIDRSPTGDFAPALSTTGEATPDIQAAPNCETSLTVAEKGLAMVRLELVNTCRPDAVVAIHHQGMMFHELTDAQGKLLIDVPVLSSEAYFIAAYDDGEGAVAMTDVPSLALYDRAVLQWQGENAVQLHALEYGATYGDDGHIWNEAPADPTQAVAGLGGFLKVLGNPDLPEALMAEVYSFPTGIALREGDIALSVEAEVTERNCGRQVQAQSLQIIAGEAPEALDLVMTLPDCDAVGEFLVLKNMFEDLTLAAR